MNFSLFPFHFAKYLRNLIAKLAKKNEEEKTKIFILVFVVVVVEIIFSFFESKKKRRNLIELFGSSTFS